MIKIFTLIGSFGINVKMSNHELPVVYPVVIIMCGVEFEPGESIMKLISHQLLTWMGK